MLTVRSTERLASCLPWLAAACPSDSAGQVCIARFRFPLWQVEVDGREQPSIACAGGLLGVHVEAGKHRVVVETVMPDLRPVGLALSLLGFLACSRCGDARVRCSGMRLQLHTRAAREKPARGFVLGMMGRTPTWPPPLCASSAKSWRLHC